MSDNTMFELQLQAAFDRYAAEAETDFDARALAPVFARPPSSRLFAAMLPRSWRPASMTPFVLALLLLAAALAALAIGAWVLRHPAMTVVPTGSQQQIRGGDTATLLPDGRVVFLGGWDGSIAEEGFLVAEIYDPSTHSFWPVERSYVPRPSPYTDNNVGYGTFYNHAAVALPDGRVLVSGGDTNTGSITTALRLFDPRTGEFSTVGDLATERFSHSMLALPDGRIAVVGTPAWVGPSPPAVLPSVEYVDPRTWTVTPGPSNPALGRVGVIGVLLNDGRILALPSNAPVFDAGRSQIALLDPVTDAVEMITPHSQRGDPQLLRAGPVIGAALLGDGRVVIGLADSAPTEDTGADSRFELIVFDPATRDFESLAEVSGRLVLPPTALLDGRLFVGVGAPVDCDPVASGDRVVANVFDVDSRSMTAIGDIPGLGSCHGYVSPSTVTALLDGSVLVAGGTSAGGGTVTTAAIIWP